MGSGVVGKENLQLRIFAAIWRLLAGFCQQPIV
jgi:hypothetical protein